MVTKHIIFLKRQQIRFMRSFSKISEPAREQELKKFKFLTSKKIAQQSAHKILFFYFFHCFLPMSNDPTSTKSTDDGEFSVTSHDCHEAIVAETERYKRQRADFLSKYGDPSSPGYHRTRADEDIPKPKVTLGDDSNASGSFEKSTMTTLEYHGDILTKVESRLFLLEEQYNTIQDTLEMLVTEARRTRQLLERRLRTVPKNAENE